LKSRHVKSRTGKWKHRRRKPPTAVRWSPSQFQAERDRWDSKQRMFVTMYGRNVGKTFVGNNFIVQSQPQHQWAAAFDFKQWSATLVQSLEVMKGSTEKMAEIFGDFKKKIEEMKLQQEEMMKGPGATPDIVGTLVGYRAFGFRSWFGPKLWPVAHSGYQWVPGTNEAVLCPNGRTTSLGPAKEPHPYPWCDCGFWAMWDAEEIPYGPLLQYQEAEWATVSSFGTAEERYVKTAEEGYSGYIWGQIEAWGVIVEATLGFRAQFAKVTELYEMPNYPPAPAGRDYIHSLGEAYGVPVRDLPSYPSVD
jgi:hypothetical protein